MAVSTQGVGATNSLNTVHICQVQTTFEAWSGPICLYRLNYTRCFSIMSLKLPPPDVRYQGGNAPNSISAGALTQTLLESYSAPRPLAGCKGSYF